MVHWLLALTVLVGPSAIQKTAHDAPDGEKQERLDELALRVRPSVTSSPGEVRAVARIAPHEDNRRLVLEASSPYFFRSSTIYLEGEDAARVHAMWFKHLPAGRYEVTARLVRSDGTERLARKEVQVIGDSPKL